jgi:hypothetical protein
MDFEGREWLTSLFVEVAPLDNDSSLAFEVRTQRVKAGQIQLNNCGSKFIRNWLTDAARGRIEIDGKSYAMRSPDLSMESDSRNLDRWGGGLHLRTFAAETKSHQLYDFPAIDAELRMSDIPFDGLRDISLWMLVSNPAVDNFSEAKIVVLPPVDLIWSQCSLVADNLSLGFVAQESLNTSLIKVAVRGYPGRGLNSRLQIGPNITWDISDAHAIGKFTGVVPASDNIIVMISLGDVTVRRQFIIDQEKARNHRYLAVRNFDVNLEKITKNLFEDRKRFEEGLNMLFFMLGFSATRLIATDGPDLILASPRGVLVLIECTVAISDFSTKLGKLVGRKASIERALKQAGHGVTVHALLITAQPAADVASKLEELATFNIQLLTVEDLRRFIDVLPSGIDPDILMEKEWKV